MPHVNLPLYGARFFALGVFVALDAVWWRDALMGPPLQRGVRIVVAVLNLVLVLVTVWDIIFFPFG